MMIGKVIGSVVASRKVESLEGLKMLLVAQMGADGKLRNSHVVAVDSVQAGIGDVVLYASGSSARQTDFTKDKPADAIIMAIIDSWDIDGELIYRKDA